MGILSCDASIAGLELNIMRQPAKAHSHQDLSLITIPFGETKQTLKSTPSLTVATQCRLAASVKYVQDKVQFEQDVQKDPNLEVATRQGI